MNFEAMGIEKVELSKAHAELVAELEQYKDNPLVAKIIQSILYGFSKSAKTLCTNEADKFRSMPHVIDLLKTHLFEEGEYVPWSTKK